MIRKRVIKMKAKEMFEKLGYKFNKYGDSYISYKKDLENGNCYMISFDLLTKNLCKFQLSERYLSIDVKELQAINKQCEELGWL